MPESGMASPARWDILSAPIWTWAVPEEAPTVTGTAFGDVAAEAYGYTRYQSDAAVTGEAMVPVA